MNDIIRLPLGKLGSYINGRAFRPSEWSQTSGLPIIRIANLTNDKAIFDYFDGSVADKHIINDGDIVVSWSATLDAFVWNRGPAVLNQHIFKVIPNNNIVVKEYLYFVLLVAMRGLSELVHGATMKHVTKPVFEGYEVSVVQSKEQQRRIAAQLNARLAEVEKACQAIEMQLEEVGNLANAIIYDTLNSKPTTKYPVPEALEEIKKGIGEGWRKYPVLGATVNGLAPAKEPPGKNPHRYKPVFPGTVFYNPMRILIGSIAFVDTDDTPGITSPDYVALRGKEGVVDSRWFYFWLRSPLGEQFIKSLARGAVRERILFKRLATADIELPSFHIQRAASRALAALKPMQQAIEEKIKEIKLLPQKILDQAFEI